MENKIIKLKAELFDLAAELATTQDKYKKKIAELNRLLTEEKENGHQRT